MSSTDTITDAPAVHTWDLPAYNLDAFVGKVDLANRRLRQAGIDARFDVAYTEYTVERLGTDGVTDDEGNWIVEPVVFHDEFIRAELVGPLEISSDRFVFAASLVPEEAGITVHSAPGIELGGYAPRGDNECDHCGTSRNRSRLYLVREIATGEIHQVGHNCLELYTGITVHGLWALEFVDELERVANLPGDSVGSRDRATVAIDTVLAWAWAYSNQGRAYVSGSRSLERGIPSTGSEVRRAIYSPPRPNPRNNTDYERYLEAGKIAAEVQANQANLLQAIRESVESVHEDTDFGRNLRVILAAESGTVSFRNVALIGSLVSIYARNLELAEQRKHRVTATAGYLGEVGERVRGVVINLTTVREWEGDYGWTTLLVGRTDDQHAVKWFRSGRFELEAGDQLRLSAVTVKAHEEFNGDDVTVLTRGTVDDWEQRVATAKARLASNPSADLDDLFRSKKDQARFAKEVA